MGRSGGPVVAGPPARLGSWTDRFGVLDQVLAGWLRDLPGPRDEVAHAWAMLAAPTALVDMGSIAAEVGWSRRHLGEQFRQEFGLPPKVVARVMRFERAKALMTAGPAPDLAAVAAAAGYSDQPHLTRDWRDLAGSTPAGWLRGEEFLFVQDGPVSRRDREHMDHTSSHHLALADYADAPGAMRWLCDTFGFVEVLVVPGEDPGVVEHAQLAWPEGGGVMLGSAGRDGNVFSQRPTGTGSAYVVTDRPDGTAGTGPGPPGPRWCGDCRTRTTAGAGFSVRDPEGNIWSLGSYRGEPLPWLRGSHGPGGLRGVARTRIAPPYRAPDSARQDGHRGGAAVPVARGADMAAPQVVVDHAHRLHGGVARWSGPGTGIPGA